MSINAGTLAESVFKEDHSAFMTKTKTAISTLINKSTYGGFQTIKTSLIAPPGLEPGLF